MAFKLTDLETKRAFTMPFASRKSLKRLGVGAALVFAAFMAGGALHDLVPEQLLGPLWALSAIPLLLPIIGYCQQAIKQELSAAPGEKPQELPPWPGLKQLYQDAGKVLAWVAIYAAGFACCVLGMRAVSGMPLLELERMKEAGTVSNVLTTLLIVVGVVLFCNVIPCLACRLAQTNKFGEGKAFWWLLSTSFDDKHAFRDAITGIYLFMVPVTLSLFTVVLFPPLLFAWAVVAANLFAQAYKRSSAGRDQPNAGDKPGDSPAPGESGSKPPDTTSAE